MRIDLFNQQYNSSMFQLDSTKLGMALGNISPVANQFLVSYTKIILASSTYMSMQGAINNKIVTKVFADSGYTANFERVIIGDTTGGAMIINLPTSALSFDTGTGRMYDIKNIGANTLTVTPNGTETIDGAATIVLNQYDRITIITNGSNWFRL